MTYLNLTLLILLAGIAVGVGIFVQNNRVELPSPKCEAGEVLLYYHIHGGYVPVCLVGHTPT